MTGFNYVLVVFAGLGFISAYKFPPNFDRCHLKDPELEKCLSRTIQNAFKIIGSKGIKSLYLQSVEPAFASKIVIGEGASAVNVVQHYNDAKVYGLYTQQIEHAHLDMDKKALTFTGKCDEIVQKAQYDLNGKILVLPIVGHGDSTITLKGVTLNHTITFNEKIRNNKKYFDVVNYELSISTSGARYEFLNLFDGDKVLGDNMLRVLNENWKEIFDDVRPGVEKAYGAICKQLAQTFFSKIPVDEIFLP